MNTLISGNGIKNIKCNGESQIFFKNEIQCKKKLNVIY